MLGRLVFPSSFYIRILTRLSLLPLCKHAGGDFTSSSANLRANCHPKVSLFFIFYFLWDSTLKRQMFLDSGSLTGRSPGPGAIHHPDVSFFSENLLKRHQLLRFAGPSAGPKMNRRPEVSFFGTAHSSTTSILGGFAGLLPNPRRTSTPDIDFFGNGPLERQTHSTLCPATFLLLVIMHSGAKQLIRPLPHPSSLSMCHWPCPLPTCKGVYRSPGGLTRHMNLKHRHHA